jgi:nucleotide-binding universal stress UspA family protein
MGTHGHTGLKHFFLGSVAEKVVRVATCPVLVTRSAERQDAA